MANDKISAIRVGSTTYNLVDQVTRDLLTNTFKIITKYDNISVQAGGSTSTTFSNLTYTNYSFYGLSHFELGSIYYALYGITTSSSSATVHIFNSSSTLLSSVRCDFGFLYIKNGTF